MFRNELLELFNSPAYKKSAHRFFKERTASVIAEVVKSVGNIRTYGDYQTKLKTHVEAVLGEKKSDELDQKARKSLL